MRAIPCTSPQSPAYSIPKHARLRNPLSGSVQLFVSAMLAHDGYDPVR
jgi:hypothetical protein